MKGKKKYYNVSVDVVDSFNCVIEAKTSAEALKKAGELEADMVAYKNVPHYTTSKVIGIDGEAYYE